MIAELNNRLNRQLDHLVEELTERIPVRLGKEQAPSAYAEALDRQRAIQRRIQYLRRISSGLSLVDPEVLAPGGVGFGSEVRVEDLRSGQLHWYTFMSGEELDLDAGEISLASPVAQALIGRKQGDEVEVGTPQGTRRFRILSTTTLYDVLGVQDVPAAEVA